MRLVYKMGLIFSLTIAGFAFLPGVGGEMLFDTVAALKYNAQVMPVPSLADSWRVAALSFGDGSRPLTMLSFAAQYAVSEEWILWQLKLVNILLHLITGVFLYYLCQELLRSPAIGLEEHKSLIWVPVLASGLWLSHPLFVSTVLYTVQRMAQLSTLFVVIGLLVFVRYRGAWAKQLPRLGEVVALCLWLLFIATLAFLSKENGILLLWLVFVIEVCFYRGVVADRKVPWLNTIACLTVVAPFFLMALMYLVVPEWFHSPYLHRDFTMYERVLTQSRVLWHYLLWTVLPNISWMGLHHDDIPLSRGLLSPISTSVAVLSWVVVVGISIWQRRRRPLILFAVLFYLVAHTMESSIIGLEMVYEHRNYMPLIGVFFCAAYYLTIPFSQVLYWKRVLSGAAVMMVLLLLTAVRSASWSDELGMGLVDAKNHPNSARSQYQYGVALLKSLDEYESDRVPARIVEKARGQFVRAADINTRNFSAVVMLLLIDSQYPMEKIDLNYWVGRLSEAALISALSAEERNSLRKLIECVGANLCRISDDKISDIIATLQTRFPKVPHLLFYRSALLSYQPERIGEAIEQARDAWLMRKEYPVFAFNLIDLLVRTEKLGEASEVITEFLKHDENRSEIIRIKALFKDDSVQ